LISESDTKPFVLTVLGMALLLVYSIVRYKQYCASA